MIGIPTLLSLVCVAAFVMMTFGHQCKDYNLSAADQSFVDMMKHYLHTSRKEKCSLPIRPSVRQGVAYVRWGRKGCPTGAELVYTGQVGGNFFTNKGGGVNYLCLPSDPENGEKATNANSQIFGAEYQTSSSYKPFGMSGSLEQKEVPCAVCYRQQRSTLLVVPGRKTCYKNWKSEYHGYLMTSHKDHTGRMDFVCVDNQAEPLDNKSTDENGALFYPIRTSCGSLRCGPYKNNRDIYCVVCTK